MSETKQQVPQRVATTVAEAFWTFNPFALVREGDPWYRDIAAHFDKVHYRMAGQLQRRLATAPEWVHLGVVGHKGPGQTTVVHRVVEELGDEFHPIYVDTRATLDTTAFRFVDVLLVIAEAVVKGLGSSDRLIPRAEVQKVRDWFSEELLTESHKKQILGELKTEAGGGLKIPYVADLFAKVTTLMRSDNEYRQEIRRRAERDPDDLIRRTNALLDAATDGFGVTRLVVVLDNLEKFENRRLVEEHVLQRSEDFRRLRCHLVLFLAPEDQYAPHKVQASDAFPVLTLPALPVRDKNDQPDEVSDRAVAAVKDLLGARADLGAVFADPDAAARLIARLSGGRLRDIFSLARNACEFSDPDPIGEQHILAAAGVMRADRVTAIRPAQWDRLIEIHREKTVSNDPELDGQLLQHSNVLNYNGEPWWDVHPLVRLDDRFRTRWTNKPA